MKKFCTLFAIIVLAGLVSCQKQQTEEERKAEIDRQVEERLAAERQAQEKEQLAQRGADLDAREKALADQQNAAATQAPRARSTSSTRSTRETRESSDEGGDYNIFYTKLEPYGDWRETSDYGYVWQPREAERSRNWHPYTDGRWVYTDVGWTWVSEERFGWATYHYGRWTRLRGIGWVWVPGNEWAPAWVSWRKSDEYVGWAPLPPEARFDRRQGIHNWADNYYDIGPDQYRFVATREFGNREMGHTIVPRERNVTIINQTTNVTNITYSNTTVVNNGPSYDELRTRSQQPIERLRLERDVNINLNVEVGRPVVRGQVIAIPAPVIAIGRPAERPRTVKAAIAQTVVEHGWEDIGDRQAAEQARTKMKSESTPPPDAPSKIFVKPAVASEQPTGAASAAPAETASPSATGRAASTVTAAPTVRAQRTAPPAESASPSATATTATATAAPMESASVTPLPRTPARLAETPGSAMTPMATPAATATSPAPSSPTTSPIILPTRGRLLTPPPPARRATPSPASTSSVSPMASPASSPSPTSTVSSTPPVQSRDQREVPAEQTVAPRAIPAPSSSASASQEENLGEQKRLRGLESQAKKFQPRRIEPMTSPTSTPTATSSPSPSGPSAPSVSPAERLTQEDKKKQKRGRKEAPESAGSMTPSPSPSP